jgi:hypothetical protein
MGSAPPQSGSQIASAKVVAVYIMSQGDTGKHPADPQILLSRIAEDRGQEGVEP